MSPLVSEILSKVFSDMPSVSVTDYARASYSVFKRQRVASAYRRICIAADDLIKNNDYSSRLIPLADLVRPRLSRLDNKEVIAPLTLDEWFKPVKDRASLDAFTSYQLPEKSPARPDVIFDQAAARGIRSRSEALIFRIQEQIAQGGYPVFWSLTADPLHDYIFAPRRNEFRVWLKKVERHFGKFTYCAVTERGPEGRLHIHTLFIFESASRFSDPNSRRPGKMEEIPELRGFWPYGFANPVACRFSPSDVWGQLGWRWPMGKPTNPPVAAAVYMAGYITKPSLEIDGCRTKMTRGFGLGLLNQMTGPEAILILSGDPKPLLRRLPFQSLPPKSILRYCAGKMIFGNPRHQHLPETRTGSVQEASKALTMEKFTRMNAGDSLNRGEGSEWSLNQYRRTTRPVPIGRS